MTDFMNASYECFMFGGVQASAALGSRFSVFGVAQGLLHQGLKKGLGFGISVEPAVPFRV